MIPSDCSVLCTPTIRPCYHYILSGASNPRTSMQDSSTFFVSISSAMYPCFFASFSSARILVFMIKMIECICKIINLRTDFMWCKFFVSIFHHLVIFYQRKHQCFLTLAGLLIYLKSCDRFSFFLVFVQDRFDTHDGVQNIRSCVSLKGSKSVYIEDIIIWKPDWTDPRT